jgi:hypothetical protein
MAARGVSLCSNISTVANQTQVTWQPGGRTILSIFAGTFPSNCFLQYLGKDNLTWININSSTFAANQFFAFDAIAGQYRISMSGGPVSGLYADLVSTPYY